MTVTTTAYQIFQTFSPESKIYTQKHTHTHTGELEDTHKKHAVIAWNVLIKRFKRNLRNARSFA